MNLSMKPLHIPFRVEFSHSSASRKQTESVLVKVEGEDGTIGVGEGCPRGYVTRETIKSALQFFETYVEELETISSLDSLKQWVAGNTTAIDTDPASWCAIELALLDIIGKQEHVSVEALLRLPEITEPFQYTAVIGTQDIRSFSKQASLYSQMQFMQYKIKLFGDEIGDQERVKTLKTLLPDGANIRADANNHWATANEFLSYIEKLNGSFIAIEEPITVNAYDELTHISEHMGIPIILDESFLRVDQFEECVSYPERWIVNIRISKMGGLLRSLAVAEQAKDYGIPLIIGAQVGETSILSRAAMTVAHTYRDIIFAQEGAYGTYLLEHDVTDNPLMFGPAGVLELPQHHAHGLGIL